MLGFYVLGAVEGEAIVLGPFDLDTQAESEAELQDLKNFKLIRAESREAAIRILRRTVNRQSLAPDEPAPTPRPAPVTPISTPQPPTELR